MMSQIQSSGRVERRFAALKEEGRAGLVTFVTAGDPDLETSKSILMGLADAGADIIELGMPFSDPMADGPAIQAAGQRALANGQNMKRTLEMVREFRTQDEDTPIILMGYFNPIHAYGVDSFLDAASDAGVDGLIIVDIAPEEDEELAIPARNKGIHFIRLATPTTDDKRMPQVLKNTSGFLYYVSVTGVTGGATASATALDVAMAHLRKHTDLPVAVGFGIKTPEQAADVAKLADAAVVGSALVELVRANLGTDKIVDAVLSHVSALAQGVRGARVAR